MAANTRVWQSNAPRPRPDEERHHFAAMLGRCAAVVADAGRTSVRARYVLAGVKLFYLS